jgi:uncharacterized protein YhhL (DUF1145 family)
MVIIKLATLGLYGFLVWVSVTQPLTLAANLSTGLLVLLAIVHLLECFVYRRLIAETPGNHGWHALNVLLFGVFHAVVMRRAIRSGCEHAG